MRMLLTILFLSILFSCTEQIGGRYDLKEVVIDSNAYVPDYYHMQAIDYVNHEWIVFYYDGYNQQTLSFTDDNTAIGEFDVYEAVHEFSGRRMTVTHTQFAHTDSTVLRMQAVYKQR